MSDMHTIRIREEFKRMMRVYNPKTSHIKWKIANKDLHCYRLIIPGTEGTPYEGGKFLVTIDLPSEYPLKPPIANFLTPIWHPNIAIGDIKWPWGSNVCLSLINWNNQGKQGGWKETINLPSVVDHIEMMLEVYSIEEGEAFPEYLVDPKDPFNPDAGQQMIENFTTFFHRAKTWTVRYATENIEL